MFVFTALPFVRHPVNNRPQSIVYKQLDYLLIEMALTDNSFVFYQQPTLFPSPTKVVKFRMQIELKPCKKEKVQMAIIANKKEYPNKFTTIVD